MLRCVPKDHNRLEYLLKLAQKNCQSKKPTDILVSLIKLAADKSIDSLQAEINYISTGPGSVENKEQEIKKLLQDNIFVVAQDVMTRNTPESRKSTVMSYILGQNQRVNAKKWVDYAPRKLMDGIPLRQMIHNLLEQAKMHEENRRTRSEGREQSIEGGEEMFGNELAAPATPTMTQEDEAISLPTDQITTLEKILRETQSPYLTSFLSSYKPKLEQLAQEVNNTNDNNVKMQLMADFDKEMEFVAKTVQTKYKDVKRFSKQSIKDLDTEFMNIKPDDKLIDNIFRSTSKGHLPNGKFLFDLPLIFRKYLDDHPDFTRLLFKTGLESHLYLGLKKALGVKLSKNNRGEPSKSTRANLGFGELWHSSLNHAIDESVEDPQLNARFKKLADERLMNHYVSGESEYKPGIRFVADKFTPLVHAGHIMDVYDQYGENFVNMPEEERNQAIANIVSKSHPVYEGTSNSPLPHVTTKPGNVALFNVHDFDKLGKSPEEARQILHNEVADRFKNAQDILTEDLSPGDLVKPRIKEDVIASTLESLMLKYAKC